MSEIDHLALDGHLLRLLVSVHETMSVTRAAQKLGITQSAVSHGLEKLRTLVGDPLYVKSGRGIAPTAQAELLVQRARHLLDELEAFSRAGDFDPGRIQATIALAANDLQRDLLLPRWLRRVRSEAPGISLRIIPSGAPTAAMLREEHCQILLTPRPPEADDIFQKLLFTDHYVMFYDPAFGPAPAAEADYLAAEHVTVLYEPRRLLNLDEWLGARGVQRHCVATVPGMAGLTAFVLGGRWIATAPSLLGQGALKGLAMAPVPIPTPPLPMFMGWHRRHQADPLQRWLRGLLEEVSAEATRDLALAMASR